MRATTPVATTTRLRSVALVGLETADVDVEVHISAGLPSFGLVGLPDKAVAESRERVRAALSSLCLSLPTRRITVNLAPGDLAKEGSHYDLAIALGLLTAMNILPSDGCDGAIVMGELGLDGSIRPVPGILAAAVEAVAQECTLICPLASAREAAWLGDELSIVAAADLGTLIRHLRGETILPQPPPPDLAADDADFRDLRDIRGQESAKRALEITAAGGHNLLMCGPPGSGKSMLAARIAGLLPPLSAAEMLEVGLIASVGGKLDEQGLRRTPPFRDPHHATSAAAMVGGGSHARPGEISLAHNGVLFLDELPEFSRQVLEALRQPLENGTVTVARARYHVTYPARVLFVAAMNPCRCGYLDDPSRACSRAPQCARDYQKRISGPLLDRIDLHVDVPAVKPQDLTLPVPGESSADVAARVAAARNIQQDRFTALGRDDLRCNAGMGADLIERLCPVQPSAQSVLERATDRLGLSARGYHRVIKVARTLADLDGRETIARVHIAEALGLRRRLPGR
ncbi:MAG: YifB family Mg chelatase-like AAA ATPase [Geminicoccaceae bacterium]|nr:YifB family Mg chelatase-like AAA ATPase [Geminicoccaceae bacterium]